MQTPDHSLPRLAQALQDLDASERSDFDRLVREHLGALMRYVEFETNNLRDAGLVNSHALSIDEVIDKTLVRALEDLPFRMQVTPVSSWLTGLASKTLASEVDRMRDPEHSNRGRVALRQSRRGERLLESSNDDHKNAVEQDADIDDLSSYLIDVLADLPTPWRRAVIFSYMDEWPESEIADVLGLESPSEVSQILEHANTFLRARLAEDALPDMALPASALRWPEMREGIADSLETDLTRAVSPQRENQ